MPRKNVIVGFLVDNHNLTSQGTKHLFEGEADIKIIVPKEAEEPGLKTVKNGNPSFFIMDIQLHINNQDCEVVAEEIKNGTNNMKMIFISMNDKGSYIEHAISALKAMKKREDGGTFIDPRMKRRLMRRHTSMKHDNNKSETALQSPDLLLSRREVDVIVQVAQGFSNKEIADKLFISERTVKTHVYNVFRKLEIENRIELTLYAVQSGLIKTSPKTLY